MQEHHEWVYRAGILREHWWGLKKSPFVSNFQNMSWKEKVKNKQKVLIENAKNSNLYKKMLDYFPDAELIDVKTTKKDEE